MAPDVPAKKLLNKEERNHKTGTDRILPKDTARKTCAIVKMFEAYILERGELRELSTISAEELDEMLASFWSERKQKDNTIHDVTTLNGEFSRLSAHIYKTTKLNPTVHPAFVEYNTKDSRASNSWVMGS